MKARFPGGRGGRAAPLPVARGPRLRFAALVGALAVALTAALASGCARPSVDLVLVICIDTLRSDHVSSYGYERETTPKLDELARGGLRFGQAYATSSWTVPSVASLMTSREVFEHGAGVPGDPKSLSDEHPPVQFGPETKQLGERLAEAGIETALFSANPFFYGRFVEGYETRSVERVDAAQLTGKLLHWLESRSPARRGFAYVHFMDVHQPNRPPEPYFGMFPSGDGTPREERHGDWSWGQLTDPTDPAFRSFRAHRIATYDGAIRFVDAAIGEIVESLRKSGRLESTLLVVTADHGEEFWDHADVEAAWRDDPRGIWGVGHGHSLYDELLEVPLVVSGPGVPTRTVSPCRASLLDVAPTVLAAFGVEAEGLRGRDLRERSLSGAPCWERDLFAGALAYGPESTAIRQGNLKLVFRRHREPQLFDLESDARELHDLGSSRPAEAERLRGLLLKTLASAPKGRTIARELDENSARDLRALGYLN